VTYTPLALASCGNVHQLALALHRCEQGALALQSSERCSISRRVSLRLQLISDVEDVLADGVSAVDAAIEDF
jgi:hypothetical protein